MVSFLFYLITTRVPDLVLVVSVFMALLFVVMRLARCLFGFSVVFESESVLCLFLYLPVLALGRLAA